MIRNKRKHFLHLAPPPFLTPFPLSWFLPQMPSLPGGPSPAENGSRKPRGQGQHSGALQDCQPEADESDSKSVVSTASSCQDWSVLEDKSSTAVVEKESQLEATGGPPERLASDMALDVASTGGEHPRKDSHQRQPPPVPHTQREASVGMPASRRDHPLEFMVTHLTEGKDGFLRPEGAGGLCVQSLHCEPQRSPGVGHPQDKFLPVDSEAPREAESSQLCPDINCTFLTQHVPKPGEATPHTVDLIQTSEKSVPHPDKLSGGTSPQTKPRCRAWGHIPLRAESEMGTLPSNADSSAVSSESVTTQMSCNLVSAAQNAVALGTDSRRTTLECTVCDPVSTAEPVLGVEARQFSDVSVQTYLCEPRSWHRGSAPGSEARPLTKSVSLDTGFPSPCPEDTCHAAPAPCCDCCHRHPHCHSACGHGPRWHGHPEAQFMKTAVRELCSVSIHPCRSGRQTRPHTPLRDADWPPFLNAGSGHLLVADQEQYLQSAVLFMVSSHKSLFMSYFALPCEVQKATFLINSHFTEGCGTLHEFACKVISTSASERHLPFSLRNQFSVLHLRSCIILHEPFSLSEPIWSRPNCVERSGHWK